MIPTVAEFVARQQVFIEDLKSQLNFSQEQQVEARERADECLKAGDAKMAGTYTRKAARCAGQVVALNWVLWKLERSGLDGK